MEQIATFHTHLGALRFQRKLQRFGYEAALAPVPRKLSASCGTSVRFAAPFEKSWADEDLDSVFLTQPSGYQRIYSGEESD
jgi:hypothetical protein